MINSEVWTRRYRNVKRIAAALPRTLGLVLAAARGQTVLLIALTLLLGCLPVLLLLATKPLVDAAAGFVTAGASDWSVPLAWAGLVAGLLFVAEAIRSLLAWIRLDHGERVGIHVRGLVHRQSASVAMGFFERPEFFDQLHRARDEATERPVQLIEALSELGRSCIAITGVAAVLVSYVWWLPLLLLLSMLPALVSAFTNVWRQHKFALLTTVDSRRVRYFDWLLTDPCAAAEMRSYGLSMHFSRRYRGLRDVLRVAMLKLHGRESLANVGLAIVGLLAAGAAVVWMLLGASKGQASLGDVALCYQAFVQASSLTRSSVSNLGATYRNALFLDDFFQFLDLPGDPAETDDTRSDTLAVSSEDRESSTSSAPVIQFANVCFSYPGLRRAALIDLNLTIAPGSIVAILGANGAGKSTLVKLLCRFYDPDSGSVSFDGRDVREMPVLQVRQATSVMFQDVLELSGTVAENVLPQDPENRDRILAALGGAQADSVLQSLPAGLNSLLGQSFPGGTGLSGGEWRRIAMARAFARGSPVLVFDEPTSAMDPWAEQAWLRDLRNHARGRTVILITHRLTTAEKADIVHIMNAGRIVESGSHPQLLAGNGVYAKLWGTPTA
jgi:ATP-binding cassette subfamily B protein